MKPIIISGSIAYDHIMNFPDSFKHHILPDQIHILSVAFVVEKLQKNLGGTAANIAHTIKLLGGEPLMIGPIGSDDADFQAHWKKHGINTSYIKRIDDVLNASAHITTDKDDNQITAFYPGALNRHEGIDISNVQEHANVAIIGPTYKETMIKHAKQCSEADIKFCFDPGQQMPAFTKQELMMLIGQATYLIGNDYEMKLLEDKTGWSTNELFDHVEVVILTLGEQGSVIMTKDERHDVPACSVTSVEDPTGAGDAYRAGFFTALAHGETLKTCGQVGSVAAAYAVEKYGTQNHDFIRQDFADRYEKTYGERLVMFD